MRTLFDLVFHLHQVPVLEILEIKDKLSMNEIMSLQVNLLKKNTLFIGPRYTWGPIYGSECLSL